MKLVFQGRRCVLKDCSMVEDDTILPPETVVPSFTKFGGSPGLCVGELPECTQELMTEFTRNYYQHFVPQRVWIPVFDLENRNSYLVRSNAHEEEISTGILRCKYVPTVIKFFFPLTKWSFPNKNAKNLLRKTLKERKNLHFDERKFVYEYTKLLKFPL